MEMRDHFAAVLFLQAQRFFERVAVGLVRFEADVGFADPGAAIANGERSIFGGNLLDADADFQECFPLRTQSLLRAILLAMLLRMTILVIVTSLPSA